MARPNWVRPLERPSGRRLIDPKDAVFVAVEGQWLAIALQIVSSSFTVGKEGLLRHKPQLHQLAGGIVDEHQQGTLGSPSFKPGVLRAIDLHQLSKTGSPLTHLVDG
jgi:hypothetical protein